MIGHSTRNLAAAALLVGGTRFTTFALAERVGFEPTEGLTLRRFSRPVP